MKNKAIFLDRDGTINIDRDYLYRIRDFEFITGVPEALKLLQDAGYKLIIITNQSGIARGFYTESDYETLNDWMLNTLCDTYGVEITASYYCPHLPPESSGLKIKSVEKELEKYRVNCSCRKPGTALFERAIAEHNIEPNGSYAIGDMLRDLTICGIQHGSCSPEFIERDEADKGRKWEQGVKGFLVNNKESEEVIESIKRGEHKNITYVPDFLSAVRVILGKKDELK